MRRQHPVQLENGLAAPLCKTDLRAVVSFGVATIEKLARRPQSVVATVWEATSVTRFIRRGDRRHGELDKTSGMRQNAVHLVNDCL